MEPFSGIPSVRGKEMGSGNGISRLLGFQQWEGEEGEGRMVSPGSLNTHSGKVRRGKGTRIPRLLGFQGITIFLVFLQWGR